MNRRKKTPVKAYYIILILCLTVLFVGYDFVNNLSEKRKVESEVTTINLLDEEKDKEITEKYNEFFAKLMSYFNIFFKETFNEYKETGMFDNKPKEKEQINAGVITIENGVPVNLDTIEVYTNTKKDINESEMYKKTILLANDRQKDFFTFSGAYNIASRLGVTAQDLKTAAEKVNSKYKITIFHTHATEGYSSSSKSNYRTKNDSENVVCIGNTISNNLINTGFQVTHLKDHNDQPSYNKAYANSEALVKKNIDSKRKNILIDIHRDGADAESNYEKALESVTRVKINDEYIATFSLVVGGKNKNVEKLKEFAKIIKNVSDELYPGLCRGIIVRDEISCNQDMSDYSLLIEVGCHLNTFAEAKKTSDFLSEVLCKSFIKLQ